MSPRGETSAATTGGETTTGVESAAGQRAGGETTAPGRGPLFKVTRGNPSDEELAALTAVLVALANGSSGAQDDGGHGEGGPWRRLPRWPPPPGPGSWRWATGP